MRELWIEWQAQGWIQAFDAMIGRYLYKWMIKAGAPHADIVASLAVLLSRAAFLGHSCVSLHRQWPDGLHLLRRFFPEDAQLAAIVKTSAWVSKEPLPSRLESMPLWLSSGHHLYLTRNAMYESIIGQWFSEQCTRCFAVDAQEAKKILDDLFGRSADRLGEVASARHPVDWQRVAVAMAIQFPVAVIAGGPGTGKTTTVVKLLAALLSLSRFPLRVVVAAPTGKAAARLADSILLQKEHVPMSAEAKARLPDTAYTVHRLLKWNAVRRRFGANAEAPLEADIVVIDEASMLDLFVAQSLLKALKPHARLILLGDANQLPAVESGAVFQQLQSLGMQGLERIHFDWLQATDCVDSSTELADLNGRVGRMAVALRDSHRFAAAGDIGFIAQAVLAGQSAVAMERACAKGWFFSLNDMLARARDQWAMLFEQASVQVALSMFHQFRLLTASRKIVRELNLEIEKSFNPTGDIFYRGQPIMVVMNDYSRMLFNGDVGMVWPDATGQLVAWFWIEGHMRAIPLHALPTWETCYAMTVHKSQGSEFNEVGIIFPDEDAALLSRQWLYTAITRAKSQVFFTGSREHFARAVATVVQRETDLATFVV